MITDDGKFTRIDPPGKTYDPRPLPKRLQVTVEPVEYHHTEGRPLVPKRSCLGKGIKLLKHKDVKRDKLTMWVTGRPAEATGSFRIAATDYPAVVVLPGLMKAIGKTAPGIQVEISTLDNQIALRRLETNALDLAFRVNEVPQPFRSELLFREAFVCLLRKGHPLVNRPLALKDYLNQKHLIISVEGGQQGIVEQTLDRLGYRRDMQLKLPYFVSVGSNIEHSDMVAAVPKRLAKRLSTRSKIHIVPAPIEFQRFTYLQI